MEVILLTGRSIEQGVGIEKGKFSDHYSEVVTTLLMDPDDMREMGVHLKDTIKLMTEEGEVVLRADRSPDAPHKGIVFLPYGPWANALIGSDTDSQGMPSFKNVHAKVEKTSERPSTLEDLLKKESK